MKTKNSIIIFILFLLIALTGGAAVFLAGEKSRPAEKELPGLAEKSAESAAGGLIATVASSAPERKLEPEKIQAPEVKTTKPADEISASLIIGGVKYEADLPAGGSVYDLMAALKEQNKIDFKSSDYSGLGFFITEINGVRNNPPDPLYQGGNGKNWLYYVNGKPAPIGVSFYKLKNSDTVEWKYEKKSF